MSETSQVPRPRRPQVVGHVSEASSEALYKNILCPISIKNESPGGLPFGDGSCQGLNGTAEQHPGNYNGGQQLNSSACSGRAALKKITAQRRANETVTTSNPQTLCTPCR